MPLLGAHMSIAGGYYRAVELAHERGCDCVQVFTKNNNQWRAKELTDEDAEKFQSAFARLGIVHPIAHDSYLINLASPDPILWEKSIEAFCVELMRAEKLGIRYLVTHPGAFTTSTEQEGLDRIIAALEARSFEVVFTDLSMPEMDGWAVARHLRRNRSGVKVVLVTGYGASIDPPDNEPDLVDAVVGKPFEFEDIAALLQRLYR